MNNVVNFPTVKDGVEEIIEYMKDVQADGHFVLTVCEGEPEIAFAGMTNPYEIIGMLDMAKDTVKMMIGEGFFDD